MKTYWNKREWLNPDDSSSTGSVVTYDGIWKYEENGEKKEDETLFMEFASCHDKCRIHKTSQDTVENYIEKVRKLYNHIGEYLHHLENRQTLDI